MSAKQHDHVRRKANPRLAWHIQITVSKRGRFHLILVRRHDIRSRVLVQFLEQGLVVLQVASTCMKTEDAHKYILIIRQVGHGFDVFDMGMLGNKHSGRISVQVSIYMYIHCTHMLVTCIYFIYTCIYIVHTCIYCIYTCIYIVYTCTGNKHTC